VIVTAVVAPNVAQAQRADEDQPTEGRIYNISERPFLYQLRRSRGVAWTRAMRLEPGKYHTYRGPRFGGRNDLAGLITRPSRYREGYLIIQFRGYGGLERIRIRATDLQGRVTPYWFYVTDANGDGRLIQAPSIEQAKAAQQELQQQAPASPRQIEAHKRKLRANHVLYPPQ